MSINDVENIEVNEDDFDEFFDEDFKEPEKVSVLDKFKSGVKKVGAKIGDGVNDLIEHPEKAKSLACAVVGGLIFASTCKSINDTKKTAYSEEIGETVRLKHELTNQEKVELDYRMKTGQTKIDALKDMELLKKK